MRELRPVPEDDTQFFLPYNIAAAMDTEKYEESPEAFDELFGAISSELTDEKLTELNARVDVDGEAPADVAPDFVAETGLA